MYDKTPFRLQLRRISSQLGIDMTVVSKIIYSYIHAMRQDLLNGRIISFLGLVKLIPDVQTSESVGTSAYYSVGVSSELNLPYYTVRSVIKLYLEGLRSDLQEGKAVSIIGVATIYPSSTGVRSACSVSIRRDLGLGDYVVNRVRVFTCGILKREVMESNDRKDTQERG